METDDLSALWFVSDGGDQLLLPLNLEEPDGFLLQDPGSRIQDRPQEAAALTSVRVWILDGSVPLSLQSLSFCFLS